MKIPKIIIQISKFKLPDYIIQSLKLKCIGWEYLHFTDEEIITYLKENPIAEFSNALAVFNAFEKGAHKSDFFRYYFLYLNGGVYIDSDAMLEMDIEKIVGNYSFFTVKSAINNDSMFNGFIGCEKNSTIIYSALKKIYISDNNVLKNDYFYICKELYNIVDNYNRTIGDICTNPEDIIGLKNMIYSESLLENGACRTINSNNETLLIHYFDKRVIPSSVEIPKKNLKLPKYTKIGISLHLPEDAKSLFSNGIRQNVLFLGELLYNIGYECYFIIHDQNCNEETVNQLLYSDKFKYIKYPNIFTIDFDLVIMMGYELDVEIVKQLKYINTKLVAYLCGNSYMIDTEKILYSQHKARDSGKYLNKNEFILYDQIWSIPQMTNTNKYYWQTLYRTKCIEVPFIWSENAIKLAILAENKTYDELLYKSEVNPNNIGKIAIFEPNISIMKWAFPSLLVCENAYRANNESIKQVFVNNVSDVKTGINDFNLAAFNKIVNNLDLCVDKKVSIEGRYNTLAFMSAHANYAVSHQWENNLNYIYFDLAWMGWPIIHNASLCKDIGYYYPDFNYEEGGQQLLTAIQNHSANSAEYIERNRSILERYLTTNVELQDKYIKIISELFSVNNDNDDVHENNIIEMKISEKIVS